MWDVSNYIIYCPGPHLRRSIQHLCGSLTKQSRERFPSDDEDEEEEEDDNSDANNDVDSHDNQDAKKKGQARMFMRIMKMKMKMLLKKCMIGALDTVNDKWDFH